MDSRQPFSVGAVAGQVRLSLCCSMPVLSYLHRLSSSAHARGRSMRRWRVLAMRRGGAAREVHNGNGGMYDSIFAS
eukprot:1434113-Pyramimonas_sp.AAC.1